MAKKKKKIDIKVPYIKIDICQGSIYFSLLAYALKFLY